MKLRQIALDTETTGLDSLQGHRIIEIGCVEIIDRRITGDHFHAYINPGREIEEGAQKVHGITQAFLADKPSFLEVFPAFFEFIDGAQLIIHNASFDIDFINAEIKRLAKKLKPIEHYCSVLDTLALARKLHPGQKNSLDALCKRYGIENQHRVLHGALLDAEILAKLYLTMTIGQHALFEVKQGDFSVPSDIACGIEPHLNEDTLPIIFASSESLRAHHARLAALSEISKKPCVWATLDED